MASRQPRAGYAAVTPRLVVADPDALAGFLRAVFNAVGEIEPGRPVELRIGSSLIMVSSTAERAAFPGFLYVYVDDADEAFDRAVAAGAEILEAPLDTPYGDRRAMFRDQFGNVYQVAHPLAPPSPG